MQPRVTIILVCYNGIEDTLECLQSLTGLTYPNAQTVIVDNASSDGTPSKVRAQFPSVHVIETGDNLGFAGGNNVGIRYALENGADYCFLLNNDTTIEPGLLEPLVEYAESHPDAGIIGPLMCYHSTPDIIWSTGGEMRKGAASVLVDEGKPVSTVGSDAIDRDFIVGCGMLVPRHVWEKNGLFDERYFLYYEESDLCFRARKNGFRCVFHPGSRLWHKVSRSTGAASELTLYYMRRNALLFLEKHGTLSERMAVLADALRLGAVWTVKGNAQRARVLYLAVGDYFSRKFGKARHAFR